MQLERRDELSFRGNRAQTRYGWLRLTPAYSVHLVRELLQAHGGEAAPVLDPFCGTGTTALVCAEAGVACDTTDINPFLLWLAAAKTRAYASDCIARAEGAGRAVESAMRDERAPEHARPGLHRIEKWWDEPTQAALARGLAALHGCEAEAGPADADLLKLAFCRALIERSNASFGHQSMSFRKTGQAEPLDARAQREAAATAFARAAASIAAAAASQVTGPVRARACDARALGGVLEPRHYGLVITSPPYPNRMSYIRELRPYMYWLGYLRDGRAAGELDFRAIGGTWGSATSKVGKWSAPEQAPIPFAAFPEILAGIAQRSDLLSRYVHKYFYDMALHVAELRAVLRPRAALHYVIGNSKFYDVLLPAEQILAAQLTAAGFTGVAICALRKRTSKRELFEYRVSALAPG